MRPAAASFTAMASTITLYVPRRAPPAGAVEAVRDIFALVEGVATRFRPDSPLMELNRRLGRWVAVPPLLAEMLRLAEQCRHASGGLFDPRVLPALARAGYPGAVADLPLPGGPPPDPWIEHAPGAGPDTTLVRLRWPADLGGIGKGFACDLAAERLRLELPAFLLDAGGDMRLMGDGDAGDGGWTVGIEDPRRPATAFAAFRVHTPCAVATSSPARHHWRGPDGPAHHLIDPRTLRPAATGVGAVTVAAATAVAAEVLAKELFIAGPAALASTEGWPGAVWWVDDAGGLRGNLRAREAVASAGGGRGASCPTAAVDGARRPVAGLAAELSAGTAAALGGRPAPGAGAETWRRKAGWRWTP